MVRLLGGVTEEDVLDDDGEEGVLGQGADGGAAAADLHSDAGLMLAEAQEQLVAEQHTTVHAFHHHLKHAGGRHSSHGGLIWMLVLLHVAFIGYWAWIWWRQRRQREASGRKPSVPQKVNCVYDWTPVIPTLPNIQLAKSAQH